MLKVDVKLNTVICIELYPTPLSLPSEWSQQNICYFIFGDDTSFIIIYYFLLFIFLFLLFSFVKVFIILFMFWIFMFQVLSTVHNLAYTQHQLKSSTLFFSDLQWAIM